MSNVSSVEKKGHIGANCKVKSAKSSDGKSFNDSGKNSRKASCDSKKLVVSGFGLKTKSSYTVF
jgi:hypothetical protein